MCIIVYKPAGTELPDDTILRRCMTKNKDGAGFAIAAPEGTYLSKGYFKYKDFKEAIDTVVKPEDDCLMHFRFATAGYINAANCHPFPITTNLEELKAQSLFTSDPVFAHNGIMSIQDVSEASPYSDSLLFLLDVLGNFDVSDDSTRNLLRVTALMTGSKFITFKHQEISMYGNGWIKDDGIWYSNSGYRYTVTSSLLRGGAYTSYVDRICPGCGEMVISWCKNCKWYVFREKCTCGKFLAGEMYQDGGHCVGCDMCSECFALLKDGKCPNGCIFIPKALLPAPKTCPRCGTTTLIEEGDYIFCSSCTWMHTKEVDDTCPKCGDYIDTWFGVGFCQKCNIIINEDGTIARA